MSRSHSRHHQREKKLRAKAHRNQGIARRHRYTPEWEREPGISYPHHQRQQEHYPSDHPPPAFGGRHSNVEGKGPWDKPLPIHIKRSDFREFADGFDL